MCVPIQFCGWNESGILFCQHVRSKKEAVLIYYSILLSPSFSSSLPPSLLPSLPPSLPPSILPPSLLPSLHPSFPSLPPSLQLVSRITSYVLSASDITFSEELLIVSNRCLSELCRCLGTNFTGCSSDAANFIVQQLEDSEIPSHELASSVIKLLLQVCRACSGCIGHSGSSLILYLHVSSTVGCKVWRASRDADIMNHDLGVARWGYFVSQPVARITTNC